jgi:transcriptional regulator with XRE-family HTH domain
LVNHLYHPFVVRKGTYHLHQQILLAELRRIRVDAGLRQADLAKRLGIRQSVISKYESGERRLDLLELREICQVAGVSLSEFVRRLEKAMRAAEKEDRER